MESLDDKIRRYRDETLRELEALERRAAALRIAVKAFDDLLNWETEHPPEGPKNPDAVSLGKLGGVKGGLARAAALTPKRRSEIASEAANVRWRDHSPSPTGQKIIAACFNWSTVREISVSAPFFRIRSLSNISTKCHDLWKHGYLERRIGPSSGGLYRKRYEYKALNPVKVS